MKLAFTLIVVTPILLFVAAQAYIAAIEWLFYIQERRNIAKLALVEV